MNLFFGFTQEAFYVTTTRFVGHGDAFIIVLLVVDIFHINFTCLVITLFLLFGETLNQYVPRGCYVFGSSTKAFAVYHEQCLPLDEYLLYR